MLSSAAAMTAANYVGFHPLETIAIVVLLFFSITMLLGARANQKIAREWCSTFLEGENSVYARNFAVHGKLGMWPPRARCSGGSERMIVDGRPACKANAAPITHAAPHHCVPSFPTPQAAILA